MADNSWDYSLGDYSPRRGALVVIVSEREAVADDDDDDDDDGEEGLKGIYNNNTGPSNFMLRSTIERFERREQQKNAVKKGAEDENPDEEATEDAKSQ